MSETTTKNISVNEIEARKAEWQNALDELNKQLTAGAEQITRLQQQAVALTGAIQACDALLSATTTDSTNT